MKNEVPAQGPGILRVTARLGVRKPRSSASCKRGPPHQAARRWRSACRPIVCIGCLKRVNFSALGKLVVDQPGHICPGGKLMGAVPVARGGHDVRDGLQTPPTLTQMLKVIAARAVNEEDERLRALWCVIKHAVIGGHSELKQNFVEPDLVLQRNKPIATYLKRIVEWPGELPGTPVAWL